MTQSSGCIFITMWGRRWVVAGDVGVADVDGDPEVDLDVERIMQVRVRLWTQVGDVDEDEIMPLRVHALPPNTGAANLNPSTFLGSFWLIYLLPLTSNIVIPWGDWFIAWKLSFTQSFRELQWFNTLSSPCPCLAFLSPEKLSTNS